MPTGRRIVANNTAAASGNPVHDREMAIALGYKNALISGADAFSYLSYPPVQRWGAAWFERGTLDCKLLKPIFDGDICDLVIIANGGDDMGVELHVEGELKATAQCGLLPKAGAPSMDDIPWRTPSAERTPLTSSALVIGAVLPTIEDSASLCERSVFLARASDELPIYANENVMHPGHLVRLAMHTLAGSFVPEVMIHVGSRLHNYRPIRRAARLEARGRVLSNYETRGHKAVLLDINVVADEVVSASLRHSMIYQLRGKPKR